MSEFKYHIDKLTRNIFRERGAVLTELIQNWKLILGKSKYSENSVPVRLTYPQNQNTEGTLTLEIAGILATEFGMMEQQIIDKISSYFGFKAVGKIKFLHKNLH